ncbi:MAG: hypothetical protein KAR21_27105, partial [Spirochaetales bacterium]|nr:hypothetical protein [Spirochaetales bacterium]
MKKILLLFIFINSFTLIFSQTHTSIDITDQSYVYILLESAQLRGLIPPIDQPKPYLKSFVLDNLKKIDNKRSLLSTMELKILDSILNDINSIKEFELSVLVKTDNNINLQDPGHPHSINALGLQVGSNIFNWLSVKADFSMMLDRTNDEAFLPYTFTKNWDHHHMDVEDRSDLSYEEFAISNRSQEEITSSTKDGLNYIRLGRFRRDWGPGENSLLLSGTGRPFLGFDAGLSFSDIAYLSTTTGSLGQTVSTGSDSEQKMISAHKLTITPVPWLSLSVWESVVFGKRLELAYLSPVSLYIVSQMGIAGDKDNSTMGFDFTARFSPLGNFYGSIFIDEIEHNKFDQLFTCPKNMFAYYAGFKAAVPKLPFGVVTLQYTKLEPFVYT